MKVYNYGSDYEFARKLESERKENDARNQVQECGEGIVDLQESKEGDGSEEENKKEKEKKKNRS